MEEVGERALKEILGEAGEKAAKEGGEALGKKAGKELIESLGDDVGDIAKVTDGTPVKKVTPPKKRPTWRQSEIDAAAKHPGYSEQKSFINGKEVPYGTKGSTRPDLFKNGYSIEVKNYKIDTPVGKSRLKSELVRQYEDRLKHLPKGTKQTAIIDTRGQNISLKELKDLKNSIQTKAKDLEIIFMQ